MGGIPGSTISNNPSSRGGSAPDTRELCAQETVIRMSRSLWKACTTE